MVEAAIFLATKQLYEPVGGLLISALIAAIPLYILFFMLAVLRLGIAAGVVALLMGLPLALLLGLGPSTLQLIAAAPLAMALAAIASLPPALAAAHGTTISVIVSGGKGTP